MTRKYGCAVHNKKRKIIVFVLLRGIMHQIRLHLSRQHPQPCLSSLLTPSLSDPFAKIVVLSQL